MSSELEKLINTWNIERGSLQSVSERLKILSKEMIRLNQLIYYQCKKEGVDIKSLNLNKEL